MAESLKTTAVNNLKFYIMLSIIMADRGQPESIFSKSLKECINEGE